MTTAYEPHTKSQLIIDKKNYIFNAAGLHSTIAKALTLVAEGCKLKPCEVPHNNWLTALICFQQAGGHFSAGKG
jgi:hypothetical protein